jgi:hypothetical protein
VSITTDVEGVGVLKWQWSWSADHTDEGPTSKTVTATSRTSSGSASFTLRDNVPYSWVKQSSNFTWQEKFTITTTITTGSCSIVEVQTSEDVRIPGDPALPVPWAVGISVSRSTGVYALGIGLELFTVKVTEARTKTTRCSGQADAVETFGPFESTRTESLALPSVLGVPLEDPDTRRFKGSARMPVDVRFKGEDYAYILHLEWDFWSP